jgi:hypothetical protein
LATLSNVHEYAAQDSKFQTPTEAGDFDPELIFGFNPKTAASVWHKRLIPQKLDLL